MSETIIFTEIFHCASVAKVSLGSFFRYHPDRKVYVWGFAEDFESTPEIKNNPNVERLECDGGIHWKFENGHQGTADVFARSFLKWKGCKIARFDSDVVFKCESLSLIENAFNEGYDLVGSRRCYKNNPGGAPGFDNCPDLLSTYFLGVDSSKIPSYDFETFCRMWQGAYCPWNMPILDFGDSVIRAAMNNGGRIKHLDNNLVGGQNENGKKFNAYKSNLHLDMGSHLCHFGGVGSGCAVYNGKSHPPQEYADWAVIRYALWCKLFYGKDILPDGQPPRFDGDGRWVSGSFNDGILETIKLDLER